MGRKEKRQEGQVLVEMLLVLPIFLTIVFTIMEMGYISFNMILLNHATFEVARVGGMTMVSSSGNMTSNCGTYLPALMTAIIKSARVSCSVEAHPFADPQAGITNSDLIVTGTNSVQMIFPLMTTMLLCPKTSDGSGGCTISATVRMPIEQPLAY